MQLSRVREKQQANTATPGGASWRCVASRAGPCASRSSISRRTLRRTFVKPAADHVGLFREMPGSDEYSHVNFDISRDEAAKWVVADDASLDAWARLLPLPDKNRIRILLHTGH